MATQQTSSITLYRITASYERDERIIDCSQAECLGDAYGRLYATEADADTACVELGDSVPEAGLDPTTTYSVIDESVEISGVAADEGDGLIDVEATVTVDGRDQETSWSAVPRHTADGIRGVEGAGDSPDCWVDRDLSQRHGEAVAVAIGREVLAMVQWSTEIAAALAE